MYSNLGMAIALGIVPLILWSVPRFRRRSGKWITPAKSIPCGCLAMVFLPELIWLLCLLVCKKAPSEWVAWLIFLALLGVGVAAGVMVTRWCEKLQRRFAPPPEDPGSPTSDLPIYRIAVFCLCLLLGMGGCVVGGVIELSRYVHGEYRGNWHYTPLLREDGMKIDFCEQSIHPFLAEYNYRLYFNDGKRTSTHWLHTNCGGRTFFNVYRLPDGRLHLVDKDAEYLVDPKSRGVLRLFRRAGEGRFFTAPYPDEEVMTSWSSASFEQKGKWYVDFNHRRVEATPADGILDGEVYFGRITREFKDAREAPEVPISEWRSVR